MIPHRTELYRHFFCLFFGITVSNNSKHSGNANLLPVLTADAMSKRLRTVCWAGHSLESPHLGGRGSWISVSSRSAWSKVEFQGQPGLHSDILSYKRKTKQQQNHLSISPY